MTNGRWVRSVEKVPPQTGSTLGAKWAFQHAPREAGTFKTDQQGERSNETSGSVAFWDTRRALYMFLQLGGMANSCEAGRGGTQARVKFDFRDPQRMKQRSGYSLGQVRLCGCSPVLGRHFLGWCCSTFFHDHPLPQEPF